MLFYLKTKNHKYGPLRFSNIKREGYYFSLVRFKNNAER